MGDPRKQRKKYETPPHPWQAVRIDEERILKKSYGLKNKKEIWKMESFLRQCKRQAKKLISRTDPQGKKEEELLLKKLYSLGIAEKTTKIEDILDFDTHHILKRRLQSVIHQSGLARTTKQARQFITHQHILVNDKKVDVPSYLVKREEETKITFSNNSTLNDPEHPERKILEKKEEVKTQMELPKKDGKPEEKTTGTKVAEKPKEEVKTPEAPKEQKPEVTKETPKAPQQPEAPKPQ